MDSRMIGNSSMTIYQEKYGFVYIWFDRKHKRYYIGSHWGFEIDGYICSSRIMRQSYNRRPADFKRRILKRIYTNQKDLLLEEERWLSMIDPEKTTPKNTTVQSRKNVRYYNIKLGTQNQWWSDIDGKKTVGEKISAAKTGKSTGPCSPEKAAAISKAKKQTFAERGGMSDEHKQALRGIKKPPHTDEWKAENSRRMKEQWQNGTRKSKGLLTEDHKKKISDSQKGKKLSAEQIELMKKNNSKKYQIKFTDGTTIIVHGLKTYALENNMKYITLHKAFLNKNSIRKHKIESILIA